MQRRVVDATGTKVTVVLRVVPHRSEVRSNVGGVGGDGYGIVERDLLRAGCGLVRECGSSEQSPRTCPNVADVGANVCTCLIEAQSRDVAVGVSSKLDSDFDRIAIATVDHRRRRGWRPDRICYLRCNR